MKIQRVLACIVILCHDLVIVKQRKQTINKCEFLYFSNIYSNVYICCNQTILYNNISIVFTFTKEYDKQSTLNHLAIYIWQPFVPVPWYQWNEDQSGLCKKSEKCQIAGHLSLNIIDTSTNDSATTCNIERPQSIFCSFDRTQQQELSAKAMFYIVVSLSDSARTFK